MGSSGAVAGVEMSREVDAKKDMRVRAIISGLVARLQEYSSRDEVQRAMQSAPDVRRTILECLARDPHTPDERVTTMASAELSRAVFI